MTALPETEEELADRIKTAHERLSIRGGATRSAAPRGAVLGTGGFRGVVDYEPGALTLVVRAGTPVDEVCQLLAQEGQRLPFEPMDHRAIMGTNGTPTMGGMVAMNVSGPRRVLIGACRDFLIGVRFVDGRGRILKNGGRVMKNVTGYDLVKLMAGSHGRLGVLTELSFKVLAQPETSATLIWHEKSAQDAMTIFTRALGSPYEVSGAARLPDARVVLRIEGLEGSVGYRVRKLQDLFADTAPDDVLTREGDSLWHDVRDVRPFASRAGNLWRTSVKPTDMPRVAGVGQGSEHLIDWGGGLIWTLAPADLDLRAAISGIDGHSTLVRGVGYDPAPPQSAALALLTQRIRQAFDPDGRFSDTGTQSA